MRLSWRKSTPLWGSLLLVPTLWGQETLHFDVASVKPNQSRLSTAGGSDDPGRAVWTNAYLSTLILYAFRLPGNQVSAPAWMHSERYDIAATKPPGTTEEQTRIMMRNLLIERFQLRFRWEKRKTSVYALVPSKGGQKLTPASEDVGRTITFGGRRIVGKNEPMEALAAILMRKTDLPVVDRTGIAGQYDFTLKWSPDPDEKPGTLPDPAMMRALEEQFGLRLEARKEELDYLIIESGSKVPLAN